MVGACKNPAADAELSRSTLEPFLGDLTGLWLLAWRKECLQAEENGLCPSRDDYSEAMMEEGASEEETCPPPCFFQADVAAGQLKMQAIRLLQKSHSLPQHRSTALAANHTCHRPASQGPSVAESR